jgi:hypothetical protein
LLRKHHLLLLGSRSVPRARLAAMTVRHVQLEYGVVAASDDKSSGQFVAPLCWDNYDNDWEKGASKAVRPSCPSLTLLTRQEWTRTRQERTRASNLLLTLTIVTVDPALALSY